MFKKIKKLKEKQNQTNGITIVALIITIIVLIILAGITLNIALGENGIFKKSKKAVDEYQKSAKAEEEQLDIFYDNLESLDPNSLAAHVKLGDYVEYNPREGVGENDLSVTIPTGSYDDDWTSIDENGNPAENLLKNGTMGSGYETSQTFTVPTQKEDLDKIKWKVLSIEDGCVNLISEIEIGSNGQWTVTGDDSLYLQGITGYAYGPQVLDQVCSIYGQGRGAKKGRSITVEDVNKLSGYNPMKDSAYSSKYGQEYEWQYNNKTYKWRDNHYAYKYDKEGLKTTDPNSIPYQLLFGKGNYWLASRVLDANSLTTTFCIRNIDNNEVKYSLFFEFDSSDSDLFFDDYRYYPVRPVVTLKSTAKFDSSGGTGTAEDPIKFTITEEE